MKHLRISVMMIFALFLTNLSSAMATVAQPQVAAGGHHTVGLKSDGSVVAVGDNNYGQLAVSEWTDMIQVAAGGYHTVGLKSDGSVVAVGCNDNGQLAVSEWTDMMQIAIGFRHTVGLKSDGSVVAVGYNYGGQLAVSEWTDMIQVAAGYGHTVGLKSNGSVVAVGYNNYGQLAVSEWTDMIQVAAGHYYTVGLKSDGSVVAVGCNDNGQLAVSEWTDMIQIAAGYGHTVGLKSDGSVVAVGYNDDGRLAVSEWTDMIQVAAGWGHTVGLKSDGSVVAVGYNDDGQLAVSEWNLGGVLLPEIEISLDSYNFGEVHWGDTRSAAITIFNTGSDTLNISDILLNDAYDVFSMDLNISPPIDLEPGESIDVVINFKPEALQSYIGSLVIESNDADEAMVQVPLSGIGVFADTPSEQVIAVTDYIQDSIDTGELNAEGEGRSADNKVNALINMIEAAGDLLEAGETAEGCQQLTSIYLKVDGINPPPDFVSGPAIEGLGNAIQGLMTSYGCE